MIKRFICLALISGLATPAATIADTQDISGAWSFETVIRKKGCTITGLMHIEPELDGTRSCSFMASEVCEDFPEDRITVEQSCRIIRQGNFYLIRSRVLQSLTEGYSSAAYLPDHFTVKPVNQTRMKGTWYDRNYSDAVTFWRDEEAPIS